MALTRGFPLNTWETCPFHSLFSQPLPLCPSSLKTEIHKDLVPEFDLSVPAAGDDLGRLVRMPQGADAHLVVGLDPVVQLGGLPVPDVQLPICVSWHHVAGEEEEEEEERSTGWKD